MVRAQINCSTHIALKRDQACGTMAGVDWVKLKFSYSSKVSLAIWIIDEVALHPLSSRSSSLDFAGGWLADGAKGG